MSSRVLEVAPLSLAAPGAGRRFAFYVATAQVLVVAGLAAGWLCLKVTLTGNQRRDTHACEQ